MQNNHTSTLYSTVTPTLISVLTDMVREEDNKEWSDEVVDTLDVAAGRVPHGPDEQHSLETFLYYLLLKEHDLRIHSRYIYGDLHTE